MSDLVHGLELDRGELAEAALTTPAVVGPFDPDHDRKAQFLSALPASTVQDVLLQQREERLHRRVVGRLRPGPSIREARCHEAGARTWPNGTGRNQVVVATPRHGGGCMARPQGWAA